MSKARLLADLETNNKGEVLASALTKINLDYVINLKNDSTGYLAVPTGTKQQEPTNANEGIVRVNTTSGLLEFYSSKKWNFETTAKYCWWGNVTIKQNTAKSVDLFFCGVDDNSVVDLTFNTVNKKINMTATIINNKTTVNIPNTATIDPIGSIVIVDVTDGTDNLHGVFFEVIS
jgi:hypothetical protein